MSNRQATAKVLTLGLAGEYGTYNANVIYCGSEAVATIYGIPMNTTLEDVNPERFAEGLKWGNELITAFNERDALLAEVRNAVERFESEHELLTKVVRERNRLREVLELLQGFDFRLDDSEHGKEIRRRAEVALSGKEGG